MSNRTIAPSSLAEPVGDPEIREVLNLVTGQYVDTVSYIGAKLYSEFVCERVEVRERLNSDPVYKCAFCPSPVYIVCSKEKRFFFRHRYEDGICPAKTRDSLSREQIQAIKYDGQRESVAHKRMKDLILRSLNADPSFSEIASEKQWRSTTDPASRRQPDVQARTELGRLVFEAQLSTTFLDVVVERRRFYRSENALLVWVLPNFDPEYRRLTTDDILFSNNSNVIIIDDETVALSEKFSTFYVRCWYLVPEMSEGIWAESWKEQVVPFSALKVDIQAQHVWLFDYTSERKRLADRTEAEERIKADALRRRILDFWLWYSANQSVSLNSNPIWASLCDELRERGVKVPSSDRAHREITSLMFGILSLIHRRPVGWEFKKLIEVIHHICDRYPEHILAIGHAIITFKCDEILTEQDKSGRWLKRKEHLRHTIQGGDLLYAPDADTVSILSFLFPDIGEKVGRRLQR